MDILDLPRDTLRTALEAAAAKAEDWPAGVALYWGKDAEGRWTRHPDAVVDA